MRPTGIETFTFIFSAGALQWLHGTTTDDEGREISNFTLFGDLLARMAVAAGESKGFRRALMLSAGQAQYSEELLAAQWNMGRKRIRNLLATLTDLGLVNTHRSRVASVMTPRTEGRIRAVRSRTDNGSVLQKRFPLFHSPAFCWNQSVLAMASGRPVWHGALAFSCEVCRGITAYGQ